MDKKMRHIADIADSRLELEAISLESVALYWIAKLATEDFESIVQNEEYIEFLDDIDLKICPHCNKTYLRDESCCH